MKLSIVIPTRERASYLGSSISTVLRSEDRDIELIVSDNASADTTSNVVSEFNDPRLRYVNTGKRVSMRQNFETGLNAASGDYVIFFGDDDGLIPGQIPALRSLLKRHDPDVLTWPTQTYGWPDESSRGKRGGLRFVRSHLFGEGHRVPNGELVSSLLNCQMDKLNLAPKIYHGCVKMKYIDSGRLPDGEYFGSSIPDVYHGYHSILRGGKFAQVNHAFTINGFSPVSTGSGHRPEKLKGKANTPGEMFAAEVEKDPKSDVLDHALSVPYAFFSTLETIRSLWPNPDHQVDHFKWYAYVNGSLAPVGQELRSQITANLQKYATDTGTSEQLEKALNVKSGHNSKLSKSIRKIGEALKKRQSFRRLAEIGGMNTIDTASRMFDDIAGDLFERVLERDLSREEAWKDARRRSNQYKRQLSLR